MATRRRIGINTYALEASRRQLMQPVPCWEKVWAAPDGAPLAPGTSTLRVYKWVKTDKKQHFSDDEGEADEPLAPIHPEELAEVVEVVEGDDDMDQDEGAGSAAPDVTPGPLSRDVSEPAPSRPEPGKEGEDDGLSKPATPKPHPLSVSFRLPTPTPAPDEDALQDALRPPQEDGEDMTVDLSGDLSGDMAVDLGADVSMNLDMAGMGPDGEQFESAADLSQLQSADPLLGGPLTDEEIGDPFAVPAG